MTRATISAVVIARDEERMIVDCLRSLAWADERLVVVDAATRDRTPEVSAAEGARVEESVFVNFAQQRNRALELATGDWVLFVDADERVPDGLRDEVARRVAEPSAIVGYWIPRHNEIFGRVVRGGGWYPDYQLRLLKRESARLDPERVVHEVPILDGPDGRLSSAFVHLNYRTVGEFIAKQERYCRLEAERWLATHGRPRARALIGQPLREFWRRYVSLGAFREGLVGLQLSLLLAWYAGKAIWLARRYPAR